MGGLCTFAYRDQSGKVSSKVFYTSFLKTLMLSFPSQGLSLVEHAFSEEVEEEFLGKEIKEYDNRKDKRPYPISYGIVFLDVITNQVLSCNGYTQAKTVIIQDLVSNFLRIGQPDDYYDRKELEIFEHLANEGKISCDFIKVSTKEILYRKTLSWEEILKDIKDYIEKENLRKSNSREYFKKDTSDINKSWYIIEPIMKIKTFYKIRSIYEELISIGIDLADFDQFTKECNDEE